ncbi:hypothetical protein MUN82_17140 [Hymenobacter aerilatus]|uniref:Uncharacterized protein n=1 Tax=Hymenobacter aerilatus TaxID=2932251 RepID=A0A8T9SRD7_9BACT|nr:hypothetical protein [Hymenobacter aerilatus]UOR04662.1 hypothetical protein MUN82_17140 [Hymenobacter aerilatus]
MPARLYTSPAAHQTQQRPRSVAIVPLELISVVDDIPGNRNYARTATSGEESMLQEMLFATLLQHGRTKQLTIRNVERRQLPTDSLLSFSALTQQFGVESILVARLYRTQRLQAVAASTISVQSPAATTTTNTAPSVSSYNEVMLDLSLYDQRGQLLWKYNNRGTTFVGYSTLGGITERLMEEGLRYFPFARR